MATLSSMLSNQAKSQGLIVRLEELLRDCDPADVPFRHRRASRQWFAERIGCSPSTLTTSIRLRKALAIWETNLSEDQREAVVPENMLEADDETIIRFPRVMDDIIFVTHATIKGAVYKLPVLFHGDRVDDWVSAYLRNMRVTKKRKYSSTEEAAKKLRIFRQFQRLHKVKTADVSDDFLLAWQHAMTAAGIGIARRNDCLRTVHNFFKWAEERGHLKYHVQLRAKGDYKDLADDYIFPISATESVLTRHGASVTSWVSTLIEPGGHSSFGSRNTPTLKQTEKLILAVEAKTRNATRNRLMMSWALETGSRVSEIVQVRMSDLPTKETIGGFIDRDEQYVNVIVDRKNKGLDALRVPMDLVLATLDYLWSDADRQRIAEKNKGRDDHDHVFLSEKGGVLATDSITRICREFFIAAKIEKANIHRLRARFITEIIESCLDDMAANGTSIDMTSDWSETVLTMARGRMGHSHIMSLRPYLNEIKIRRIQIDGRIVPRDVAERRGQQEGLHRQMLERIKHNAAMVELDRLSANGEKRAAIAKLRQMANEMEAQLAA